MKIARIFGVDETNKQLKKHLQLIKAGLPDALLEVANFGAKEISNSAMRAGLFESGDLVDSFTGERDGENANIVTSVSYAVAHEFGVTIRPKVAEQLVFEIDDETLATRKVVLPARPYIRPTLNTIKSEAGKKGLELVEEVGRKIAI